MIKTIHWPIKWLHTNQRPSENYEKGFCIKWDFLAGLGSSQFLRLWIIKMGMWNDEYWLVFTGGWKLKLLKKK